VCSELFVFFRIFSSARVCSETVLIVRACWGLFGLVDPVSICYDVFNCLDVFGLVSCSVLFGPAQVLSTLQPCFSAWVPPENTVLLDFGARRPFGHNRCTTVAYPQNPAATRGTQHCRELPTVLSSASSYDLPPGVFLQFSFFLVLLS
jgi:hypothetical protein